MNMQFNNILDDHNNDDLNIKISLFFKNYSKKKHKI